MTRKQLLALIADLQARTCELDDLEVKTARGGTPGRLFEDISAFANSAGGVFLFGFDERRSFAVVGVTNAQQLQSDLATNAAQLSPQPVLEISRFLLDGEEVVVAEVDELPPSQRPAHLKSKDETYAWTRVGNSTQRMSPYQQRMSPYQVFGYLSAVRNRRSMKSPSALPVSAILALSVSPPSSSSCDAPARGHASCAPRWSRPSLLSASFARSMALSVQPSAVCLPLVHTRSSSSRSW
jgi:hypothetical protein